MLMWWSLWPLTLLLSLIIRSVSSFRGCFVSKRSSFLSFVVHRMVWHWRGTDGGRLSAPFDSKQDYFLSSKREALFRPRSAFSLSHTLSLSLRHTLSHSLSDTRLKSKTCHEVPWAAAAAKDFSIKIFFSFFVKSLALARLLMAVVVVVTIVVVADVVDVVTDVAVVSAFSGVTKVFEAWTETRRSFKLAFKSFFFIHSLRKVLTRLSYI